MNFRTEVKILRVEPEGTMTLIEGGAPDGSMVMLLTRVVEPLRVGDSMTLTLTAEPAAGTAGPSMWERMQARLKDLAPTNEATPRLSITLNNSNAGSSAAPAGSVTAADNVNATGNPAAPVGASTPSAPASASASGGAPQTSSAPGDASSMLLSSILGASPRGSVPTERNVVDEMDALFGARRKG